MTKQNQKELGNTLWAIANDLRGAMNADDFRDYMLSFLFLRYLSGNFETAAKKELGREGTMAIILPHGVLFRGGAEERIRHKLLADGYIDTVIGLPANLFFSTGIPVCILVLKKCKKPDDVLFINASERFEKGKRQNQLSPEHIKKIVTTYQFRKEEDRYSRRVAMDEIKKNDFNLNISRYISTAETEVEIDLKKVHSDLTSTVTKISAATKEHNKFLKELGLPPLPL